jgi:hypothetical protein
MKRSLLSLSFLSALSHARLGVQESAPSKQENEVKDRRKLQPMMIADPYDPYGTVELYEKNLIAQQEQAPSASKSPSFVPSYAPSASPIPTTSPVPTMGLGILIPEFPSFLAPSVTGGAARRAPSPPPSTTPSQPNL